MNVVNMCINTILQKKSMKNNLFSETLNHTAILQVSTDHINRFKFFTFKEIFENNLSSIVEGMMPTLSTTSTRMYMRTLVLNQSHTISYG